MKASSTTEKSIASSTLIVPRPRSEWIAVARRFLQLLLAPQTLWALLLIPLSVVLYQTAVQLEMPLARILLRHAPLLGLMVVAALGLVFRERWRARAERFFFHSQPHQEQLLAALLEQMENFPEVAEVIYHTCQGLNEVYQATPIHFFFRAAETRDLKLVYSYGAASEVILIPEDARLRTLLKREGQALEYPFAPGVSLPPTEQDWLERLQARMLVPMTGKDHRLLGLITLSEKRSAPPYNPQDYLLLQAISEQITQRMEQEQQRHQTYEQAKAPLATLARLEAEMQKRLQATQVAEATATEQAPQPNETPQWI
jgi:hypothetical protein